MIDVVRNLPDDRAEDLPEQTEEGKRGAEDRPVVRSLRVLRWLESQGSR